LASERYTVELSSFDVSSIINLLAAFF